MNRFEVTQKGCAPIVLAAEECEVLADRIVLRRPDWEQAFYLNELESMVELEPAEPLVTADGVKGRVQVRIPVIQTTIEIRRPDPVPPAPDRVAMWQRRGGRSVEVLRVQRLDGNVQIMAPDANILVTGGEAQEFIRAVQELIGGVQ